MNDIVLTETGITAGVWHGRLQDLGPGDGRTPPAITVSLDGHDIPGLDISADEGVAGIWSLRLPLPDDALNDGWHSFLITSRGSGRQLASFTIAMGNALDSDIRAELNLLRAELDLLKRAFRRHCSEDG